VSAKVPPTYSLTGAPRVVSVLAGAVVGVVSPDPEVAGGAVVALVAGGAVVAGSSVVPHAASAGSARRTTIIRLKNQSFFTFNPSLVLS
jgi:hypothetical protein